jgi:hypothetical protein
VRRSVCAFAALAAAVAVPLAARAGLPPEDQCPVLSGRPGASGALQDALPSPAQEGMVVKSTDLLLLESLLPEEVWQHRDVFFYEGMQLAIGPCHRRYTMAKDYLEATEKFSSRASLDAEGNLLGYVAGTPFPPDAIDPAAPEAGARWAWNLEHRYRGAGPKGSFRLADYPSRIGAVEIYEGEFFQLRTSHRSDLVETRYAVPEAEKSAWVAGGVFAEPTNARHLAWRQFRADDAAEDWEEGDDTFVYVPTMRKPRRAAQTWTDGMFMPRYRMSGDSGGGPIPFGSNGYGPTDSIQPTAGISAAVTENIRRGFLGLALRPNAYRWTFAGYREVLAPLNGERPGYPENPDRNYGPNGLSVANDRWDVRYAAVIEGQARREEEGIVFTKLYIDYQTQQPLYYITRNRDRLIVEVGILVSRYSGDTHLYPAWPDGAPGRVFDPVAAVFYSTIEGGTGWRRESYDVRSVPTEEDDLEKLTSVGELTKGR